MIERLERIGRSQPIATLIGGAAFVVFLGLTDYLTGAELSFSIFYLAPISLITIMIGRTAGIATSVVSAALWLLADLALGATYSTPLIPYWNTTVRLGYFVIHACLLTFLTTKYHEVRALSFRDALTGAANWRFFDESALRELARGRRERKPLTFAYFDLDNFKSINDTLGHEAGDDLLRLVADLVQSQTRPSDVFARVGGDEFVLLLPATAYAEASIVLTRIRASVADGLRRFGGRVTLSMGAVTFTVLSASVATMIKRADETMYAVKQDGKNALRHDLWPPADPDEIGKAEVISRAN